MKKKIHQIIIESDTRKGRFFDFFIQSLIILSLLSFSFETLPNLDYKFKSILRGFEVFCIVIFTCVYVIRVCLTNSSKS